MTSLSSAWWVLLFAGLLEVCWAVGLKYTEGFTRPIPSAFTLVTLAGSMYLLSKAAQSLSIGTAYSVWVGIGAVGAGLLGIIQGTRHASQNWIHDSTCSFNYRIEIYCFSVKEPFRRQSSSPGVRSLS